MDQKVLPFNHVVNSIKTHINILMCGAKLVVTNEQLIKQKQTIIRWDKGEEKHEDNCLLSSAQI